MSAQRERVCPPSQFVLWWKFGPTRMPKEQFLLFFALLKEREKVTVTFSAVSLWLRKPQQRQGTRREGQAG